MPAIGPQFFDRWLMVAPVCRVCAGSARNNGTNILKPEYLLKLMQVQNSIYTTPASDGSLLSKYCFQPMTGQGCLVETPLDYWCVPTSGAFA